MIYSNTFWELLYLKKIEICTDAISNNSIDGMDTYDLYVYCMIAINSGFLRTIRPDRKPHWRQRKQFRSK